MAQRLDRLNLAWRFTLLPKALASGSKAAILQAIDETLRNVASPEENQRWVRIEVSAEGSGTQVYVKNVTPPPAPRGLSEKEIWSRVGRGPDGKPLNENQMY